MHLSPTVRIAVGEQTVILWRKGSSSPRVAVILGRDRTESGNHIVLDRVIQRDSDVFDDEWKACGAFVTELRRALPDRM